jgi:hypothetical protein
VYNAAFGRVVLTGHDVVMSQFEKLDALDSLKSSVKCQFCSAPPQSETDNEMAIWLSKLTAARRRAAAVVGDNDVAKNFVSLCPTVGAGIYFYTEGGMDTATPLIHTPGSVEHRQNLLQLRDNFADSSAAAETKLVAAKQEVTALSNRLLLLTEAQNMATEQVCAGQGCNVQGGLCKGHDYMLIYQSTHCQRINYKVFSKKFCAQLLTRKTFG